jgi:3' terminal RNA ribose 2'-O-methyltransferase Hen1
MSVALNKAFRALLSGQSNHRQELVDANIPLEVRISVLPCRGGLSVLEQLFTPLGYEIEAKRHTLDEKFPDWGDSQYYTVTLKRICPLKEFLSHLYVLIPVLDNDKHYYISDDEIEKLLRFGGGWLEKHPEKEMITRRYLQFRSIANEALARLIDGDKEVVELITTNERESSAKQEEQLEEKISLNEQRMKTVIETLKAYNTKRVIDLGCGEGKLLKELFDDGYFEHVTGCDVSSQALERANVKLRIERLQSMQRERISLMQTALTYRDKRLL